MRNARGADAGAALWYSSFRSPVGVIYMAAHAGSVVEIGPGCSEEEFLGRLSSRYRGAEVREDGERFVRLRGLLNDYFRGLPVRFDPPHGLSGTPFQTAVWRALREIPYGETRSYGAVAARVGSPGASRAVGGACGRNPLPIIIPCHRVIAADGSIGGYTGGVEIKRALLAIEGVKI